MCPIIDVISDDTFEYMAGSDMTYGGFNWKLNFRWYPVPQREMDRRKGDRTLPVRSALHNMDIQRHRFHFNLTFSPSSLFVPRHRSLFWATREQNYP